MKHLMITVLVFAVFTPGFAQQADTSALPKGWWHIPKTDVRFTVGGYVKADIIHDFDPIGSPDFFDVSKIPTDGSEGQSTHFNLKETRILMEIRTPSKIGDIRAYAEGDFYGSGATFRMRHAFIEIADKLLIGQWWSNFMDESIIPNTLDFEKPGAYAFSRHGMVRFKQKLSAKTYMAIALEEPSSSAVAPSDAGAYFSPLPDLTARYRYTDKWGHVQLSAFAGLIQYRYESDMDKDDIGLFGLNLSGRFNFFKRDYCIYQVVAGPGVGRYRSGLSAAPDANQSLEPLDDYGFTLGYGHAWSSNLTSLIVYNSGGVQNLSGQSANSLKKTDYLAANLIWNFAENTMAGVEYLWGKRVNENDAAGTANRLQFSVKYSFNMH